MRKSAEPHGRNICSLSDNAQRYLQNHLRMIQRTEGERMEERQDDLDNLIIKPKKPSGLKKILLAAAMLLLVLILIILITKSLIEEESAPQSSIILPPEPVTEAKAPTKEPLFEQVPIEEESSSERKIDQVIDKLKKSAPKNGEEEKKAPEKTAAKPIKEPAKEPVAAKPQQKNEAAVQKEKSTAASSDSYFIQVGAFFRYPPDKKFLDSIKKEGLDYIIVEGIKSGKHYKKVLVGPYPSRSAAKSDLERVKKRINQNAYITRKK